MRKISQWYLEELVSAIVFTLLAISAAVFALMFGMDAFASDISLSERLAIAAWPWRFLLLALFFRPCPCGSGANGGTGSGNHLFRPKSLFC